MSVSPPVAPATPARPSRFRRAVSAFIAAVTSPTAVKAEKSVAVLVVARVLLAVGASTGLVALAVDIVNKL